MSGKSGGSLDPTPATPDGKDSDSDGKDSQKPPIEAVNLSERDSTEGEMDWSKAKAGRKERRFMYIPSKDRLQEFPGFPVRKTGETEEKFMAEVRSFWYGRHRAKKAEKKRIASRKRHQSKESPVPAAKRSQPGPRARGSSSGSGGGIGREKPYSAPKSLRPPAVGGSRQGLSYAAAAGSARSAEPWKLYIHSVVGDNETAPLDKAIWTKIHTRIMNAWFATPQVDRKKIKIDKSIRTTTGAIVIPEDEHSRNWVTRTIESGGFKNIKVWNRENYGRTVGTIRITKDLEKYGIEKVLTVALDDAGLKSDFILKPAVYPDEEHAIIRILVPEKTAEQIVGLGGMIRAGPHKLQFRFQGCGKNHAEVTDITQSMDRLNTEGQVSNTKPADDTPSS